MKRRVIRALLASAALAAAVALAGCNGDSLSPTGRALAPLSDQMVALLQEKHMDKDSPILLRIFKEESQLEVWKKNQDGQFALLKTYPICRWSGQLGPKMKEGDRQAPEGFYTITRAQMNPNSNYYLSFNTGYPNAFDRAWGRTGSELMVHGDCSSRGCYAMTDGQIQEIYALAREAFFGGQTEFQLQAYPFHMTALNMAKHRNNPNFAFWKELKQGYDAFEATHQEPKVAVCEKHYVFDPAAPEGSNRPLQFNPRGKCPVYRLDPTVADAILDYRRQEQIKMAQYIADGVSTEPVKVAADGGMNPVFVDKLRPDQVEKDGRVYNVADLSSTPVTLPATAGATPTAVTTSTQPVRTAQVPVPEPSPLDKPAPQPAQAKPATIAGLITNLFGSSSSSEAAAAAPTAAATDLAAKPKAKHVRAAKAHIKPTKPVRHAAPKTEARRAPAPEAASQPPVRLATQSGPKPAKRTADAQPAAPNMRTAYSSSQTDARGVVVGAQPTVPTGNFDSRWSGLR